MDDTWCAEETEEKLLRSVYGQTSDSTSHRPRKEADGQQAKVQHRSKWKSDELAMLGADLNEVPRAEWLAGELCDAATKKCPRR